MSAILAGDRLPNFMRPDKAGRRWIYYDECCGVQSLLVSTHPDHAQGVLEQLTSAPIPDETSRIALISDPPDRIAGLVNLHSDIEIFPDDGSLHQIVAADAPIALLALDSNQRVLLSQAFDSVEALTSALPDFAAAFPCTPKDPGIVSSQAPVLMLPRVLAPEFCSRLIAKFDETGGQPSGVLKRQGDKMEWMLDPDTKDRREFRIENQPLLGELSETIGRRVLPEIRTAFNYQVTRFEVMKVVRYDADTGGYFHAHRDNVAPDTAHRRFAMTVNLNTHDYSGGDLLFPEYGKQRYRPEAGAALVFSCSLAHEVMRVSSGKRYALLSFFFNDDPNDGQTGGPV